jgi:hypothetical protein
MTLDDIISLDEAAEIAGRQPVSMRRAAAIGKLDARRIGQPGRALWVTTREAVSEYLAYVASVAWAAQPRTRARRSKRRARRPRAARVR